MYEIVNFRYYLTCKPRHVFDRGLHPDLTYVLPKLTTRTQSRSELALGQSEDRQIAMSIDPCSQNRCSVHNEHPFVNTSLPSA